VCRRVALTVVLHYTHVPTARLLPTGLLPAIQGQLVTSCLALQRQQQQRNTNTTSTCNDRANATTPHDTPTAVPDSSAATSRQHQPPPIGIQYQGCEEDLVQPTVEQHCLVVLEVLRMWRACAAHHVPLMAFEGMYDCLAPLLSLSSLQGAGISHVTTSPRAPPPASHMSAASEVGSLRWHVAREGYALLAALQAQAVAASAGEQLWKL
jgi:hypothetical protein